MYLAYYSSPSDPSGAILGVLLLAGLIAAVIAYNKFKMNGMRPRELRTNLSAETVRGIFRDTVAGKGWSIVDEGNPMVAQSTILTGIRQQIALQVTEVDGGGLQARIAVTRYAKKVLGGPTKAYTLRFRIDAFLGAVQRTDAHAVVRG
jgi:hypothetical protein